jgi:hypothetical protein
LSLLRFLGLGGKKRKPSTESESNTATVRKIAAQLERLDPESARYLAAFAYVWPRRPCRSQHRSRDLAMERIVSQLADLAPRRRGGQIADSRRLLSGTRTT